MPKAISNTSPLLYLYRIGRLAWLPDMFEDVWTAKAVVDELTEGRRRGYDVPRADELPWLRVVVPSSVPSEWLALDLGLGELEVLALAMEHPERTLLLDDSLARRIAQAAKLEVWGTLRVALEAKARGLTPSVGPVIGHLRDSGMWISEEIENRVLSLAEEVRT